MDQLAAMTVTESLDKTSKALQQISSSLRHALGRKDQDWPGSPFGLNGTSVYRRDDPMWDLFTPPWGYQCRCGVNLLTVEAAARKGVVEARRWERTGEPPVNPEHRLDAIPFRPEPGFVGDRRLSLFDLNNPDIRMAVA